MKLYSGSGKYGSSPKAAPKRKFDRRPANQDASRQETHAPAVTSAPVATGMTPEQIAMAKKRKMNAAKQRNIKVRRLRKTILGAVAIFLAIMLGTFGFFAIRRSKAMNDFRDLIEEIQQIEIEQSAGLFNDNDSQTTEPDPEFSGVDTEIIPDETEPATKVILDKYAPLYLDNSELYAWLTIPGTKINYPVMRSFESNDEYLHANFEGEYSYCGIPFADVNCSHESDNILIYGHNMKDGTMFRDLMKYEKKSFWKKHPTIMFSDLYEDYEYEVLAAFYDRVYNKKDNVFKFYQFVDAENQEEFDYAVSQFKEKSLYDTGVNADYGDHLITLITCSYQVDNGRFVVVARRK